MLQETLKFHFMKRIWKRETFLFFLRWWTSSYYLVLLGHHHVMVLQGLSLPHIHTRFIQSHERLRECLVVLVFEAPPRAPHDRGKSQDLITAGTEPWERKYIRLIVKYEIQWFSSMFTLIKLNGFGPFDILLSTLIEAVRWSTIVQIKWKCAWNSIFQILGYMILYSLN